MRDVPRRIQYVIKQLISSASLCDAIKLLMTAEKHFEFITITVSSDAYARMNNFHAICDRLTFRSFLRNSLHSKFVTLTTNGVHKRLLKSAD